MRVATDHGAGAGEPPERAGRSSGAPFVVFGTWMVLGLFLDGWSHNHHKPETFFTPWHGMLYSGFAAALVWFAWDGRRRRDEAPRPAEDRLTLLGLGLFGAGAVSDFGWHTAFGIERNIAALLSPTHLLLMTGGILMVSTPIRSAWSQPSSRSMSWRDDWPVVGSLTLSVAVTLFFLMYLSPFRATAAAQPNPTTVFHYLVETAQIHLIASVLVTTAVLISTLLLLIRRWDPPFGTFTVVFSVVAIAMCGLDSFQRLPLALVAVVGGLAADGYIAARYPIRILALLVPVAIWLPYFVVFKAAYALPWEIHLWLGTVVLAALTGLGLSVLADPPKMPASAQR